MKNINSRPYILVANSSWYLLHYRELLIKEIKKRNYHLLAISPTDSSSESLSKLLIHIPWRMSRSKEQSLFSFIISLIRLIFLIRAIKPQLIHSHTLQANLITSISSSIFGINCVLSFAGLGRFSNSKGLSKIVFIIIFRLIYFFNNYQRFKRFKFLKNPKRSIFIFQNQSDIDFIKDEVCFLENSSYRLIAGSGVPEIYISRSDEFRKNCDWIGKNYTNKFDRNDLKNKITFIYCARLLKSKGILIFLELAKLYPSSKFLIFGSRDSSSKDSISKDDITLFEKKYNNIYFMNNKKYPLLFQKMSFPILIFPSFYGEGFPRAIVEANTLSIPVISSKEAAEKIPYQNSLYICEKNDLESNKKCINKILREYYSDQINERIENARKTTINNFSEKEIVKQTIKIYDSFKENKKQSYLLTKDKRTLNNWLPK